MILFASGAHPTMERARSTLPCGDRIGRLLIPADHSNADLTAQAMPIAADNAAFSGFDEPAFRRMLEHIAGLPCQFVTAPDVVGDAEATMVLWPYWQATIRAHDLTPALVLQDGLEDPANVPWDTAGALFIGGTTEYKLGDPVVRIVAEANRRGVWVHMGRVNSLRRIQYAGAIGCDSFDGSKFSAWRDTYLPEGALAAAGAAAGRQHRLEV